MKFTLTSLGNLWLSGNLVNDEIWTLLQMYLTSIWQKFLNFCKLLVWIFRFLFWTGYFTSSLNQCWRSWTEYRRVQLAEVLVVSLFPCSGNCCLILEWEQNKREERVAALLDTVAVIEADRIYSVLLLVNPAVLVRQPQMSLVLMF